MSELLLFSAEPDKDALAVLGRGAGWHGERLVRDAQRAGGLSNVKMNLPPRIIAAGAEFTAKKASNPDKIHKEDRRNRRKGGLDPKVVSTG